MARGKVFVARYTAQETTEFLHKLTEKEWAEGGRLLMEKNFARRRELAAMGCPGDASSSAGQPLVHRLGRNRERSEVREPRMRFPRRSHLDESNQRDERDARNSTKAS